MVPIQQVLEDAADGVDHCITGIDLKGTGVGADPTDREIAGFATGQVDHFRSRIDAGYIHAPLGDGNGHPAGPTPQIKHGSRRFPCQIEQ